MPTPQAKPNMKTPSSLPVAAAGLLAVACTARAQVSHTFVYNAVDLTIPDGSPVGVSDTHPVALGAGSILDVQVSVAIEGGFTGDLFALLIHEGKAAVLLNRSGRRTGDELGYDDSGMSVTFNDAAASDVHTYRLAVTGSHSTPLGGGLGGSWQPDGRAEPPSAVLDTTARSSFLQTFVGDSPDGPWTLFLADTSPVGEATLRSWSLQITVVPEPANLGVAFGLGLAGWAGWRRRNQSTSP